MSESKLLIADGATVLWAIFGVLLFELTSLVSAFELAVSGPIFDLTRVTRRKPTASALSFTHKFTESQTDVSDAVEPNLFSEDRGEE